MNEDILLQVENLKIHFPGRQGTVKAVDNISFTVKKGETFGLVGESGCGKTTAGKGIVGIHRPTAGHVLYKGLNLASATKKERSRFGGGPKIIFRSVRSLLDPRQKVKSILREAIICDGKHHSAERCRELL